MRKFILLFTHLIAAFVGFALGIYLLPILTAPPAPTESEISQLATNANFTGEFQRDRKDSDRLHWGEGTVTVGSDYITLMGKLAPGPDYKLYLSPEFVETEADFERLKPSMARVSDIKTFENFVVEVPSDIAPSAYNTAIVWCESFGEFITSAKYQ